ncbi:serine/threonine protein kinase [Lecanora helva]
MTELDLDTGGVKKLFLQRIAAFVAGNTGLFLIASNQERPEEPLETLKLPKNRSTGDLLSSKKGVVGDGRLRVSFDAGSSLNQATRSSIAAEHERGLGISGLRRIRQQPQSRTPTTPSSPTCSYTLPPRSASMTLGPPTRRFTPNEPASPTLNFKEDLSRFPSESLHSFSFAQQSEDVLHNRQSVLKRAIDFMRDRLGLGMNHPGIMTAQAKISGDSEIQSMVDLLVQANILGKEAHDVPHSRQLHGPLTGPADVEDNIFAKAFDPQAHSSLDTKSRPSSDQGRQHNSDYEVSRPGSSQPEPSLNSELSAADLLEPRSPLSQPDNMQAFEADTDLPKMKRTYTDLSLLTLQTKLVETMAKPYHTSDHIHDSLLLSPTPNTAIGTTTGINTPSHVHGHNNRWVPAVQAVFSTEAASPWTILAANDLACLVFGVTKAEVKKLSMLEVVRHDRRAWLEAKLRAEGSDFITKARQTRSKSARSSPKSKSPLTMGGGVTAQLLSKPSWRLKRAQTDEESKQSTKEDSKHQANKSRGVLLCGDIVPIQKRNGATGAASLWVKEKRGGLIWVLEEISEDIARLTLDSNLCVTGSTGAADKIWCRSKIPTGINIRELIPYFPSNRVLSHWTKTFEETSSYSCTAKASDEVNIPVSISLESDSKTLRVSSFPHIAGIIVLSAASLEVVSSNSVFSAALFGQSNPTGQKIDHLIPQFGRLLGILTEEDNVQLVDGIVVPEHSFRRARGILSVREGSADTSAIFLRPSGLVARHRDGSEINVDVQMRVVRSEQSAVDDSVIEEQSEDSDAASESGATERAEVVYALWITYSRQLHSIQHPGEAATAKLSWPGTPHQPSPGQASPSASPELIEQEDMKAMTPDSQTLSEKIQEAASEPISESPPKSTIPKPVSAATPNKTPKKRKKISDFVILEDMGQGAYGQVKLARYIPPPSQKVVLKYVTKRRILVDTWTRDRRLGTVPLEIHVLDYLRRDEFRHPNIVEMTDFFEDDVNYYIEMVPHGLPGMDLFDYIEMRSTMDEAECRTIFLQVVDALHHLHTKAMVVHRDIKDENIILDGEGKVKLIDFGSAAYIKNGPFDVFVGTIDYAAPEVLSGKSYRGPEQDIWALGILLYTLIYKENPFYSIDEILDHELRVPWIMSEASINLVRMMLNRDVKERVDIEGVRRGEWCCEGYGEGE